MENLQLVIDSAANILSDSDVLRGIIEVVEHPDQQDLIDNIDEYHVTPCEKFEFTYTCEQFLKEIGYYEGFLDDWRNRNYPFAEQNRLIAAFMGWKVEKRPINEKYPTQQWLVSTNGNNWSSQRCVHTTHPEFDKAVTRVSRELFNELGRIRCGKYQSDWNELIPVIEKIESLGYYINWFGKSDYISIGTGIDGTTIITLRGKESGFSKIETIYQAVLKFIDWYNNQNK